ncbi:hypothetical protein COLO4_04142 [Corchorus olitorius]|uniref:F-box domain-containing protein n=1 Tax=Corchorus olitorius TaxID=93759 RepID=A0A1R3KV00_9ROSI|nr:hypothetical protein COLO4_04142 [Corchorus olitorius]
MSMKTVSESKEEVEGKGEDKISSLPDDVLLHILSFLESKDAFKTRVLSKRWLKVGRSIHSLSLEYREGVDKRSSFNDFINGVLLYGHNRLSSLTSFSLCYESDSDAYIDEVGNLNAWIAAAISFNPESFRLWFDLFGKREQTAPIFKMPPTLFQCQKLVTLELGSIGRLNVIYFDVLETGTGTETVWFPSLKVLLLQHMIFKDENTLKNLLPRCPVLETLYLSSIPYIGHNVFVLSPSLKVLKLDVQELITGTYGNRYIIEAPKLERLYLQDLSLSGFSIKFSPCLVSAVMQFNSPHVKGSFNPSILPVLELFQGISNVKSLTLCTHKSIILKDELANLPVFPNLTRLHIGGCKSWEIFPCILQNSPCLKLLILDTYYFEYCKSFKWRPLELVPKCLALHLEFVYFDVQLLHIKEDEDKHAMKMFEYFLENGKVLKEMNIICRINSPLLYEDMKKLLEFPKASEECQILLSEPAISN